CLHNLTPDFHGDIQLTDCIHIIHVATFYDKNTIFSLHSQILYPYLQCEIISDVYHQERCKTLNE
ncbi:hypothetical protein, partial [Bacteroides fragilis]